MEFKTTPFLAEFRRRRIRKTVRRTLRHFGVDMIRWRPQSSPEAAFATALIHHHIDTVLDVGANEGQYGKHIRELGFKGRIISFEPLSSPYKRLQVVAAMDSLWTVAPRTAVGREEGHVQMNLASNGGASSSIFPMLAAHGHAAPTVSYIGKEMVRISRLDRAAKNLLVDSKAVFLKVDVQGYELEVLHGATGILPFLVGAELELSFAPLYAGQPCFLHIMDWMRSHGFDVWGIVPGFTDNSTGQLLQADVVFFRS